MLIESFQNPKVKKLVKLFSKSSERKQQNAIVVEGIQENRLALFNGFKPIAFYIEKNIFQDAIDLPHSASQYELKTEVFNRLVYRENSGGIIGVYTPKYLNIQDIHLPEKPIILIAESIEKPGNLGAILRTADAFKIDYLITTDPKTDIYNPNVIRSSVGCIFTIPIVQVDNQSIYSFLHKNKVNIFTTFMENDSKSLFNLDLRKGGAMVFGTEHSGLSDFWKNKGQNFNIPMFGQVDSLNVSNAVAISLYEMKRSISSNLPK